MNPITNFFFSCQNFHVLFFICGCTYVDVMQLFIYLPVYIHILYYHHHMSNIYLFRKTKPTKHMLCNAVCAILDHNTTNLQPSYHHHKNHRCSKQTTSTNHTKKCGTRYASSAQKKNPRIFLWRKQSRLDLTELSCLILSSFIFCHHFFPK